jgi:hypothetical protein
MDTNRIPKQAPQYKTWGRERSKGNKTVPTKMVTTRTEDGHK